MESNCHAGEYDQLEKIYFKTNVVNPLQILKSSYHTVVQILVNLAKRMWRSFSLTWYNYAYVCDCQGVLGHVLQGSTVCDIDFLR